MKFFFFYLALLLSGARALSQDTTDAWPHADISNGIFRARLYLPDSDRGYYRGTRFDWAGVMPELDGQGHQYCGQWYTKYNPTIHDVVMGPVESFAPLGYDQAPAGGTFVAIGIGVLTRPDDRPYNPFRYYPIADHGAWRVLHRRSAVIFVQTLANTYVYRKTVELVKGKARLRLVHELRNTGRTPIETTVYDHNLFLIDKTPPGPGLTLTFPFRITGESEARGIGQIADIDSNRIVFKRAPGAREQVYAILQGFGAGPSAYDIVRSDTVTHTTIRITCDRPLSRLVFWGSASIASPEPYIDVRVEPGQTFRWTITYDF